VTGAPATVRLSAAVAEVHDGSPGDLSLATVTFREGSSTLCGPVGVSGGSASCTAALAPGDHDVVASVGGRYAGSGTGHVVVTRPASPTLAPTPTPTPVATATPASPSATPAPKVVPAANPVLCSARIALTDVSRHGRRVRVAGFADRALAGTRVALLAGRRTAGHATVQADGSFSGRVRAIARRYRARSGSLRSAAVALSRPLTITSVRGLLIHGTLSGRRHARRWLAVTRAVGCGAPQRVARVRTDRLGRFTLRMTRPAAGTIAAYRVAASLPVVISAASP
jgi:hypothetical protein